MLTPTLNFKVWNVWLKSHPSTSTEDSNLPDRLFDEFGIIPFLSGLKILHRVYLQWRPNVCYMYTPIIRHFLIYLYITSNLFYLELVTQIWIKNKNKTLVLCFHRFSFLYVKQTPTRLDKLILHEHTSAFRLYGHILVT